MSKLIQALKIIDTRQHLKSLYIYMYLLLPREQENQPASQSHEFWTPPSVRTPS